MAQAHSIVQKRAYKQKMYRNLIVFLVFYSLFVAISLMQRNVTQAYYTEEALRDIFLDEEFLADDAHVRKTFYDIGEVSEFWEWSLGPFLNGVSQKNAAEQGFILRYNRILGSARVRQLRVRGDRCEITSKLAQFYDEGTSCYAIYSAATRDVTPYGVYYDNSTEALRDNACARESAYPGFCWRETESPAIFGRVANFYDRGGYYVDLSYNGEQARQQLEALRDANWIDSQTSAVLFTVNVLNPHVGFFVNMVFVIEFTPGGGMVNSANFRSFKSDLYHTRTDFFRLGMECVWALMLALWVMYDFYEMCDVKRRRGSIFMWLVRPWWNFLDVLNKIVFVATTVWYVLFYLSLERFKDSIEDLNQDTEFVLVEDLGFQWVLLFNIVAVNIMISTFTVFKYLNVNPRMSMMWKTLEKASPDLAAFLVFFGIIFIMFVSSAYLMFGTQLDNFRTFSKAVFACFNMLLGSFEFDEMERDGNKFFAPFFFTLFMILVTFILVNMFLAIVQDAYVVVQQKYKSRPTLAVALRRWVQRQVLKARSCVGKTALHNDYDVAVVQVSRVKVRRMIDKLHLRDGEELTREEIIRALPNAPDTYIDYLYNIIGDPDAIAALYEVDDDDDEDDGAVDLDGDGIPDDEFGDLIIEGEEKQVDTFENTTAAELLRTMVDLETRLKRFEPQPAAVVIEQ